MKNDHIHLQDIQFMFNRAVNRSFSRKKLLFMFILLSLCGVLVVFFRGLKAHAGSWVSLSLNFLPVFLCAGVLLAAGIFLIRIYHDEIKERPISLRTVFAKSWEVILGASYFSIPIILVYLMVWMAMGIFVLLSQVPGIGDLFRIVLAFCPFLLNLFTLILVICNAALLFFFAPVVALKGLNRTLVTQILADRLKRDFFANFLLFMIALLPLMIIGSLLMISAALTDSLYETAATTPLQSILTMFFLMIPFAACLTPAVIFFFNFAAESHVIQRKAALTG